MKTSNKLIIAYLILIVASVTVLCATSLQHDDIDKNIVEKKILLKDFSAIVVEKNADLHLEKSDSNILTIEILKNQKIPSAMYRIKHDTLYVYGGLRTFVKAKNIGTIEGRKHYWLGIKGFYRGNLKIILSGGKTNMENEGLRSDAAVNLDMQLNDSALFESMYIGFDTLKIVSKSSKTEVFQSSVKVLDAALKENSTLNIPSPNEMHYTHESGCKIGIY